MLRLVAELDFRLPPGPVSWSVIDRRNGVCIDMTKLKHKVCLADGNWVGVSTAACLLELFWLQQVNLSADDADALFSLLIDLMDDARGEQWRLEVPDTE